MIWNFWLGVTGKLFNVIKKLFVEVCSPNRDNAGKAEMLSSFECFQLGAGEGLLWAGRGS